MGPSRNDRRIVISIYRDGLSRVPDINVSKPSIDFRNYKPWACRRQQQNNNTIAVENPDDITANAREEIYQFIDQPGKCLRSGVDVLNFDALESEDLSNTTAPGFEHHEWMLVDTKEKMLQCIQEIEV